MTLQVQTLLAINEMRYKVIAPPTGTAQAKHRRLDSLSSVQRGSAGGAPGRVQVLQAGDEDLLEDVADARAAGQLADRHVAAAAVQHLAVAHRVRVQQLQQQRAPARRPRAPS
jgi:hypothetical protein